MMDSDLYPRSKKHRTVKSFAIAVLFIVMSIMFVFTDAAARDHRSIYDGALKWSRYGRPIQPYFPAWEERELNRYLPASSADISELSKNADDILKTRGYSLRRAYDFAMMKWVYNTYGPEKGTAYFANHGLKEHEGNCYVMAATLVILARKLGYEAYQVEGYIPTRAGGFSRHSWAEIKYNGQWRVFDPDFEEEGYGDGWNFTYGKKGTWRYLNITRMSD